MTTYLETIHFLHVARQAAAAGAEVLCEWQPKITVKKKGPNDLVSEADLASQQVIREIVLDAFPEHEFVGEEDDPQATASPKSSEKNRETDPIRWIVDPLDGTTNYVHGLEPFAVSIAVTQGEKVLAGVIHDPVNADVFTAVAGGGAFLNDSEIGASNCVAVGEALVATSFPPSLKLGSPELARFEQILVNCQSVRRLGSAAMNLCYVATGSLDAYFATNVNAWDIAAGWLIVQEAGGVVAGLDGNKLSLDEPKFVAAATPNLAQDIQKLLDNASH